MKISNDVLAVLSAAEVRGNELFLRGQLDRKMYQNVNKVLEAAGGKWSRVKKAHVFEQEACTRIDQIILSGEVDIPKDDFDYFPTPSIIVDRLIALADVSSGMRVLEPSAGQGSIAYPLIEFGAVVDCIELMEANAKKLVCDSKANKVLNRDFLLTEPDPVYDRIVMNPPFSKQADIKHVLHALDFLKDGGVLVSVMSAGVLFRKDKLTKDFCDLVYDRGGIFEELPAGAFKSSGTMVKTIIAVIPG